jgi:hypothetical protein
MNLALGELGNEEDEAALALNPVRKNLKNSAI